MSTQKVGISSEVGSKETLGNGEEVQKLVKPSSNIGTFNDSESESSDDEAPEEEGLSSAKETLTKQAEQRELLIKREQELLKEKRRKMNLKFTEQQEQKRIKEQEEASNKKRLEAEMLLKFPKEDAAEVNELPEELPEDFFDNLDENDSKPTTTKPTHVNFNDIDENYAQEIIQELKKKKKKTLQQLRKNTVKRGPVTVSLLSSLRDQKSLAPKKEIQVTRTKDKWLKRKSLNRK